MSDNLQSVIREPPLDLPDQMRQVAAELDGSAALKPQAEYLRAWASQLEARQKQEADRGR